MSVALDVIILIVALTVIVADTKKGFVKSFMGLISTAVAMLLAYAFTPWLSAVFRGRLVLEDIATGISSTLKSLTASEDGTFNLEKLFSSETYFEIAQRYGAKTEELKEVISGKTAADAETVDSLSDLIAAPAATLISNALAFLVIFIGFLLLLRLLTYLMDLVFSLPVLHTANTALGFVFGFLSAFLLVWGLSVASAYLITALGTVDEARFGKDIIEGTYVVRFFSENHFLGFLRNVLERSF